MKIVYIDDDYGACSSFRRLYKDKDTDVYAFSDHNEAVEHILSDPPNICFIDYRMPIRNGIELRRKLPNTMPCVLLSGELELNIKSEDLFVCKISKPDLGNETSKIIEEYRCESI